MISLSPAYIETLQYKFDNLLNNQVFLAACVCSLPLKMLWILPFLFRFMISTTHHRICSKFHVFNNSKYDLRALDFVEFRPSPSFKARNNCNISSPITKASRRGLTALVLPNKLFTGLPVRPSHKMGFRSSVSKSGLPGEGRHEGLVPRNGVLTNGFI